ncbi:MAG: hypothetical protein DRN66_02505 [Candidatus Nanohalarchaeota archaeon]|nr:MAG: hypothetical protein DRN66_02505 [Candidatus Nanohaloarchaeota archaeon]
MVKAKAKKQNIDIAVLNKILKKYGYAEETPELKNKKEIVLSKEFTQYKKEEKEQKKLNWYEHGARFAQKVFNLPPLKEGSYEDLKMAIKFLDYKIEPHESFSLTYLAVLISLPIAIAPLSMKLSGIAIPKIFIITFLLLPLIIYYYFYSYLEKKASLLRMNVGGELVMAILYMIIYMKTTPNLEGAIRFTAKNITGKIANDFNLLLWKVEIGKFSNIYDALDDYLNQWHNYNRDFIESIHLIRESMLETNPYRREILLDKSVSVILDGSQEKMKKYVRALSTPIAVLHGLGIMLPILAMLMFPLFAIFMGDSIDNIVFYMFLGYDVILPLLVFVFMKSIMEGRPITHSKVDISEHPDYTSIKNMILKIGGNKKIEIPVLPISLLIFAVLALPGFMFMLQTDFFYTNTLTGERMEPTFFSILMSISIIIAMGIATISYYFLTSFQKVHLTEEIDHIEDEFEDALFALGNRMGGGTPIEKALAEAQHDTQQLSITVLFLKILQNMHQMSMPFGKALFDKEQGVLRYYPSKIIKTIMKAVSSAIKKGTKSASLTTLTIATYLHSLKNTQTVIDEMMAPTISSLKFQSYILIPMISGVVVCVSKLMMSIVFILSKQLKKIGDVSVTSEMGGGNFDMINIISPNPVPPELLQLIVGIYIIETLILMAKFTVRIDRGEDKVKENTMCWHFLLGGISVYLIVYVMLGVMFNPLIEGIVSGLSAT